MAQAAFKPERAMWGKKFTYLPLALSAVPDPDFFFNNPRHAPDTLVGQEDFYSEAKMVQAAEGDAGLGLRVYWYGNFFPDMRAWDKLEANIRRGAGGRSVYIQFPHSEVSAHMSVFAAQTYKKAHRHGPGRAIIIPAGEGYSVIWRTTIHLGVLRFMSGA